MLSWANVQNNKYRLVVFVGYSDSLIYMNGSVKGSDPSKSKFEKHLDKS